MKFIEVYETSNGFDFYRAMDYLKEHSIEFQILHEYRLNLGLGSDPAILRVKESDISIVKQLLVEGGFLPGELRIERQNELKDKSNLDTAFFREQISLMEGNSLSKVYYILSGKYNYDLGSIHSVDVGVVFYFENGLYLSWELEEEDVDFEIDHYIPPRYELKFLDIREDIYKHYRLKDVSQTEQWTPLIGKPVIHIKTYTQDYGSHRIITDLVLEMDSKRVAIFSAEEPSEEDIPLYIDNQWTLVVFDAETIKKSERIEN